MHQKPSAAFDLSNWLYTAIHLMVRSRFGEICSCCSLAVLPGPAWVLLNNVFFAPFVHLCILTFDIRVDHRDLVIGLNDEPVARVRDDGRLHLDAAVPGRGRVESLEGR